MADFEAHAKSKWSLLRIVRVRELAMQPNATEFMLVSCVSEDNPDTISPFTASFGAGWSQQDLRLG